MSKINICINGTVSRGVKEAYINDDGHLIFGLTDGRIVDLGAVKPERGVDYWTQEDMDAVVEQALRIGALQDKVDRAEMAKAEAQLAEATAVSASNQAADYARSAEFAARSASSSEAMAIQAQTAIENMGVSAETLPAGSEVTVEKRVADDGAVTLNFGFPAERPHQEFIIEDSLHPMSNNLVTNGAVTRGIMSAEERAKQLGLDNAKHNDIPIITSVDSSGRPTMWSTINLEDIPGEWPSGETIELDATLTAGDKAAQAKAVGEALDKNRTRTMDSVNPLYANQFLGVLKSYCDNRQDASGNNIFAYGHNTAVDGYTGNQIDCSAYVALGLMGIPFDQSPYAGLASSPADKDDDGSETATGSGETDAGDSATNVLSVGAYEWAVDLKKYQREKGGSKAPIRTAAQMCEWLESMGLGVEYASDFSNIRRGDIVFYAKMDGDTYRQPDRYKKVSHVAVVSSAFDNAGDGYGIGAQYPYKHTMYEVSTFGGIVLNTTLEKRTPEYIVSICRPPFGAVGSYTVSGGVANQQDSTDVNRMFNEGICYLTSSITAGLPDGVANGLGLSLKVEKTYNKWGKPYSIVQTLYNTRSGDLWSRMQYCYPSYVESPSGWTVWKQGDAISALEYAQVSTKFDVGIGCVDVTTGELNPNDSHRYATVDCTGARQVICNTTSYSGNYGYAFLDSDGVHFAGVRTKNAADGLVIDVPANAVKFEVSYSRTKQQDIKLVIKTVDAVSRLSRDKADKSEVPSDDHINALIDAKLGGVETVLASLADRAEEVSA